jgi:hypothetical protein
MMMVAWVPKIEDAWMRLKKVVSSARRSLSLAPETGNPKAPFEQLARKALGSESEAKVLYCVQDPAAVVQAVEHAVGQNARHVIVAPLLLETESTGPEGVDWKAIRARITEMESRYPQLDLVYLGPPFDHAKRMDAVLQSIRKQVPEAAERLKGVIRRGFHGDDDLFMRFMKVLQNELPPEVRVAMRGSAVTGVNYSNGGPFDHGGPGTSDLDLVLVGDTVLENWPRDCFYIPGLLTKPLGEENGDMVPWLEPVRKKLQKLVGRPVHIQAMPQWLLEYREDFLNTPFVFLDA